MNKPNKEFKIRKNKTYKTSQCPKVMGTHGGFHSGLRQARTGDFIVAFGHGHPLIRLMVV